MALRLFDLMYSQQLYEVGIIISVLQMPTIGKLGKFCSLTDSGVGESQAVLIPHPKLMLLLFLI